jgi:uncharacterized 2Fe-2S/4Fe-4S cluster protein (DUF4445 family)
MDSSIVHFLPSDKQVKAAPGDILVDVAMDAGIHINAACGGEGACGKCRILLKSGEVETKNNSKLTPEEFKKGYRLACQSTITGDITVEIPETATLDQSVLKSSPDQNDPHDGRRVVPWEIDKLISGVEYNPALKKYNVTIDPPTLDDNTSDLSRLLRALKQQHNLESISIDFLLLKKISHILRDADWNVTVTLVQTRMESQLAEHQLHGSRRPKMISVEPGDTTGKHYSIVLDIGTTTLWGQLIDLNSKKALAEASEYNPQVTFGDDVITRIVFSQKKDGLERLQKAAIKSLNKIINDLLNSSKVERQHISHITAAGNTVMTHLLLGLDPKFIRETPYTPVANFFPPIRAIRIGLELSDYVYLYTFPSVASYVGGDIVSGVLSSGIYKDSRLTLYIDIGTNGEIVVGNSDWLMTASCSAGPAFEGGGLKYGMRATTGAIERFHINPETLEPMIRTIGNVKPKGICGSGAIIILAEFLRTGVIDQSGKFNCSCTTSRIRPCPEGSEYVLAYKEDTKAEEDIVITEADIDNLIRAKAAMFAGYQCLLNKVGLTFQDLERVIIAGAFGNFIDLKEAIVIGLLPEIPTERYSFIGNGSLLGAKLISLSNELLDDGEKIARKMTNVELSEDHSFMDKYMAALFLPHTDSTIFPETFRIITSNKKVC